MSVHLGSRFFVNSRRLISAVMLVAVVVGSPSFGSTILLDDTWADGDRTDSSPGLPSESPTFVGIPSGGGSVSVVPGTLSYVQSSSSQKMWTYFSTPSNNPVTLNVGEKLLATVVFVPKTTLYSTTSRNFRVGLFYDPTNSQITTDVNSDGGGSGNPWADAEGYSVKMPISNSASPAAAFQIGKRTVTNGTVTSLLGSDSAYTYASSGGAAVSESLNTEYTLTYLIDRVSATQSDLTLTLSDSSGVLATQTVSDNGATFGAAAPYTKFDHLFFRFSSASGTADQLDFKRLKVERIPEPGSLAFVGLGLASVAVVARRRR